MLLGGEVETSGNLGQQASDGERHAWQHGDGVKEIGERANWVASHWLGSRCCWRRLHHDPSTAIVDNYFQRPSFSAPHFSLAMPSGLTPTRDSRDSTRASERETFFATPPLTSLPNHHHRPCRPSTRHHRHAIASQSIGGQPPRLLACAVGMIGVVLFCLFGVCFVQEEESKTQSLESPWNPISLESIHPPQTK